MKTMDIFRTLVAISAVVISTALISGCDDSGTNAPAQDESNTALPDNTQTQQTPDVIQPETQVGDTPAQSQTNAPPVLPSSTNATVYLTEGNNGQTITMHPGDTLDIALVENSSTGYGWSIISFDHGIISGGDSDIVLSDPCADFVMPDGEPSPICIPPVGAPHTVIFHFEAVATGSTPLSLIYQRSWAPNPADHTFQVEVIVE